MSPTTFLQKKISELEEELRNYKNLLYHVNESAWRSLGGSNPPKDKDEK